ncbi:MAG: cytochrome P450 [Actinomycetota bacterium]|nr:cytochrome P450 [Actinomycetota bacterium]
MAGKCPLHGLEQPLDDAYFANPYATYARLNEAGPVHRFCLPDGIPVWAVTSYDEVREWLRDQRLARHRSFANEDYTNDVPPEGVPVAPLVMEDPPEHGHTRRLVNYAFMPKRVAQLRDKIDGLVSDLLDNLAEAGADGKVVDLAGMFCAPLPIVMVSEMLGVPKESWDDVRRWTDDIFGRVDEGNYEAKVGFANLLRGLIAERTAEPRDDLISVWAQATDMNGEVIPAEMVMLLILSIYTGGFDSTLGALAASAIDLMNHPQHAAEFVAKPELVPAAVEELLRRNGSVHRGFRRFAREEVEIAGHKIGLGDTVMLYVAAADRDPKHFPDPDVMDFNRPPHQHIAFGRGPHVCPGAELARLEIRIGLHALFSRFPGIRLAVPEEELEWRTSTFIRVPKSLPVVLS